MIPWTPIYFICQLAKWQTLLAGGEHWNIFFFSGFRVNVMKNAFASDMLTKPDFWGGEPEPKSAQIHHGNKFSPGMAAARHWILPNLGEFGSTQNSRNAYRLLLNTLLMDILENCAHWLRSNIIKWKREIHSVLIFWYRRKISKEK